MLLLSMMVSAHVFAADNLITEQVTINVATAGTLSSKIPKADKYRITNLKLTGELNVEDIKFIRQMASYYYDNCKDNGNLQHLDLGGAKFVGEGEFTVSYGGGRTAKFSSNVVGDYVFCALKVLQSIVLPDGLQLIRDRAFLSCSGLSSVTLPNGLQTIGEAAFLGCKSLSSVTLPDGLQTIGKEAFADCYSLSSVSFPDGLQTIDYEAFWDCTSLSSVSLPDGLQTIGEEAFMHCTSLSTVSFPDGLQTIGGLAFSHTSLSSVSLPNGLQSIGEGAFSYCNSLSSVSLPDGLQTIGKEAFNGCKSLTSVYANMKVPIKLENHQFNDKTMQYGTLYVPVGYRCAYMESEWKSFKDIKEFGTLNTDDLITNQVAVNVETAGTLRSKIAIEDKFRITNLKLTGELNVDDIMLIREMAGCYYNDNGDKYDGHLQHLDLSGAKFVGESEFTVYTKSNSNTAKFTSNAVGNYVFYTLEGLKTIVLPDGLQSIGYSAFSNCSSLSSVTLPEGLQAIGASAFKYCESLTSVYANMKVPAQIGQYTFDDYTTQEATLHVPAGYKHIYMSSDWKCFKNIISDIGELITEQVTVNVEKAGTLSDKIADNKFLTTNLKLTGELNVDDIKLIREMAGCYYNTDGGKYDGYLQHLDLSGAKFVGEGEFTVYAKSNSNTAKFTSNAVGEYVFYTLKGLKTIVLPKGLQTIDGMAFEDCENLTSVSLPEGLQTIGEGAFSGCSSLTSVSLPEGLQTIGSSAFYGCSSLSSVSLPEGLKTIGSHAFYNCSSLTSVFLPDGLQTIDYSAFEGCSSLTSVSLPEGLQTIGASAFKYCESLTSVYANMKVPAQMEQYTFGDNTTQNATLFVPVGYIYTYMNSKWKCFKNIKEFGTLNTDDLITNQVAVNVETAGTLRSKIAIEDKFRITNLKLTGELNVDDIMLIREMAGCYYNDNGDKYDGHLQHLDLSGAKFVGGGEFAVYDGSNSNTAKFTNNAVGDYVFYALESLKTIALYDDLKEFGSSAFACCKNLTSVSFPRLLTKIKDSAFVGCSSLTSVSFPKILTEIGGSAFAGCSSLISVIADMKIPAKIEENTFDTETVLDATLYVPQGCIEKYENADYWRYFQVIKEIGTQTGIDSATTSDDVKEVARYGINGQLQNGPTNGVNIVKYSDGTTKRVMVK